MHDAQGTAVGVKKKSAEEDADFWRVEEELQSPDTTPADAPNMQGFVIAKSNPFFTSAPTDSEWDFEGLDDLPLSVSHPAPAVPPASIPAPAPPSATAPSSAAPAALSPLAGVSMGSASSGSAPQSATSPGMPMPAPEMPRADPSASGPTSLATGLKPAQQFGQQQQPHHLPAMQAPDPSPESFFDSLGMDTGVEPGRSGLQAGQQRSAQSFDEAIPVPQETQANAVSAGPAVEYGGQLSSPFALTNTQQEVASQQQQQQQDAGPASQALTPAPKHRLAQANYPSNMDTSSCPRSSQTTSEEPLLEGSFPAPGMQGCLPHAASQNHAQQQQQQQQQQFEQLQQQQLQIEQQQQKQQQLDQQQQMHAYAEYYANYYAAQYGGPEHFNYFYTMCIQQYLQHSQQQQPQQPLQQSGGGAADAGPVALPAGHQGGDLPVAAAHAAGQQCLQQQAAASVPARDAGSDSNSEAFALYSNIASANATSLVTSSTLPMGLPGATQPALPALYHQGGGNLYSKQYQMAHATGALSELPISDQAARVCPNGRPPHPFVSFGFGGRVLVVQSRSAVPAADGQSVGVASPNMLTLTTFPKLHAALVSHACDHASPSQHTQPNSHPHVGASGLLSNSILGVVRSRQPRQRDSSGEDPMLRVMADFPGPLGPSTSKDAVLKFIHERIAAFALEDPHASQGPEEVGRMMWQALAIMVKHEGLLKHAQLKKPGVCVKTGSPTAEQELIQMVNSQALACPPPSSSPNLASTTAMSAGLIGSGSVAPLMGPPQDDLRQQAAAEEVQRLVVQGRQQEAINVAIQAQLWGIALLIAKSCGEVASSGVITSMAYSCLVPGTPLRTMALMLAGKAEQAISPHHHGVQEGTLAPGMRDGQVNGVLLSTWRDNLAVMVGAARTPADVDAIVCLGDKLQAEGAQVLAAQLCYLVAGLRPSPFDLLLASRGQPAPSSSSTQGCAMRYCLLGVDHFSAPRTFAHVLAIQRTEILEWACGLVASGSRPASVPKHSSSASAQDLSAAGPGALPPLLPYKLVHAQLLTEYGRVQDALAYCQALDVHLRASGQGGCIPLLVKELESFKDRLLNFASAHSINVSRSESSITKIGRFLDGKLNKLLWGAHEQGASTGPVNKSQDLGPPKSAVVAFAGPDAPVVSLQIPSRGSTPGPVQAQGAGPHPVMSRVPSSQGLHAASSPPSHFSSAGESQMLRLHSQDLNVLPCPHKGTSLSSSRDALPSLLHNVSSTTTLGSTNDFCTPPGHSRQASGDASPWQTQVPQEAAKRLLLHQRGLMNAQQDGSLMARSSSSPGLDQHLQENNSSSQGGVPESAMPSGLPPLPPKSEERKAKSQVPTPGKSWGLMGLLTAGSKRMGSVVAQGKDAVAHAKGAAQEDKQLSTGAEKSQGFYYDKARGRWVIEGEEEPAEPPPPPPPPPTVLGQQPGGSPGCSKPNEATSPPLGPQMPVSVAAVLPNLQRGKGMRSRYVDPLFSGSTPSAEQAPPSSLLPVPPPGNSPIAPPSTFYVPSAPTNLTEGIAEGSSASNDHPNIVNACEHRNEMAPNEHLPPSVGTPAFGPLEAAFSGQNDSQDFKDVAF